MNAQNAEELLRSAGLDPEDLGNGYIDFYDEAAHLMLTCRDDESAPNDLSLPCRIADPGIPEENVLRAVNWFNAVNDLVKCTCHGSDGMEITVSFRIQAMMTPEYAQKHLRTWLDRLEQAEASFTQSLMASAPR